MFSLLGQAWVLQDFSVLLKDISAVEGFEPELPSWIQVLPYHISHFLKEWQHIGIVSQLILSGNMQVAQRDYNVTSLTV